MVCKTIIPRFKSGWLLQPLVVLVAGCAARDEAVGGDAGRPADAATLDAESPDAAEPLAFVTGPAFILGPDGAPLAGRLELTTNRATRVSIAIGDPDRSFTIELPTLAIEHAVPVLGFRAATEHTVTVTVTDEAGRAIVAEPFAVTTLPLPADFPTYSTRVLAPALIESGVTLLGGKHYVLVVDQAGEVVWYVDTVRSPQDVRRLPSGNLLVNFNDHLGAYELDMYGAVLRRWHAGNTTGGEPGSIAVAADSFHHELGVTGSGDLLMLSSERRELDGYPTSELDPTPRTSPVGVVGDVVVVFAQDGTVLHSWSMFDVLDPYRIGYGSFGLFWSTFYTPVGSLDWSHGNAVVADPSDGGYLVSLRHQDALVKLDAAGELVWILGTHDNWSAAFTPHLLTPVGTPFAWQFHQHAPEILPSGNILVFDNGNGRVSPPTPLPASNYSRAVEFAIDPMTMEVRQVWEYDAEQAIYAFATGDVDVMPVTGNVVVTFGTARRLHEVSHTEPPVLVFEMTSSDGFYRTERLPSLYP